MKKDILILLIVVFLLNIIWEFSHHGLYIDLTGIPFVQHMILASIGDLFLVGIIFGINSVFRKNVSWIKNPGKSDYRIIVFLGVLVAVLVEMYGISQGRWVYKPIMPTIWGIGVSPLVQLFSTSILSLWSLRFRKNIGL